METIVGLYFFGDNAKAYTWLITFRILTCRVIINQPKN